MTDLTHQPGLSGEVPSSAKFNRTLTAEERRRNTARRFASERRFRYLGLGAVLLAGAFLVTLLWTIVGNGIPAFFSNNIKLPVDLTEQNVRTDDIGGADYRAIINNSLKEAFPQVSGRNNVRTLRGLVSGGAPVILREKVLDDPALAGGIRQVALPLSDTVDLYLKSSALVPGYSEIEATAKPSAITDEITITSAAGTFLPYVETAKEAIRGQIAVLERRFAGQERSLANQERILASARETLETTDDDAVKQRAGEAIAKAEANIEAIKSRMENFRAEISRLSAQAENKVAEERLTADLPSLLISINGGVVKATKVTPDSVTGDVYLPLKSDSEAAAGEWSLGLIQQPENARKISDKEIVWIESIREQGYIESGLNEIFFTRGASREPEMAGIWGAVVGSFLTMVVTLLLSFPIGVAAAIYLEEFAPKNRITDLIEVNINNLAAVPSIVFGLLGLAVFINWGQFPRSAALVGGMVLALMTLPTIIIASRAALKSVPPSIREAALGIGASKIQAVFHHVLPLAMPGILTGTIIGMAQALGETAPLLMIGMVAFIVDVPGGFTDPATVLPVQIYMWADFPEIAFQQKTAAAILVLLAFLILMNALAVLLRKRFERRW